MKLCCENDIKLLESTSRSRSESSCLQVRHSRKDSKTQCSGYIENLHEGNEVKVNVPSSVLLSLERPGRDNYSVQSTSFKLAIVKIRA